MPDSSQTGDDPAQESRTSHRTALVAVTTALLCTSALAAAASTSSPGDGHRTRYVTCAEKLSTDSDLVEVEGRFDPADPGAACAREWDLLFPETSRPRTFTACYFAGSENGSEQPTVFPRDEHPTAAQACAAVDSPEVTAP